jgi:hypothetical protein
MKPVVSISMSPESFSSGVRASAALSAGASAALANSGSLDDSWGIPVATWGFFS